MADDVSSGEIEDLMRRIKRLESATNLQNASVTKGRLRFIGGLLLIDSGGTLTVIGTMNGTGDFNWTGPWTLSGAGDITGDVDLTGDFEVLSGGRIKVGNIILNPSDEGGSVDFGGGRKIHAASGYLGMYDDGAFVVFNSGGITISPASGPLISVGSAGMRISGLPTRLSSQSNGAPAGTIWQDTSGYLYRVVTG